MKCENCGEKFRLSEVRVDEHWKESWSIKPVSCYCPHCGCVLKNIHPDTIELAKNLNKKNVIGVFVFFCVWGIGLATDTLNILAPITLLLVGVYLIRNSKKKDHSHIGWLLTVFSTILFIWLNVNAR